ncbi:hypothetical protein ABZP36_014104 [Zizania latifolia]
MERVELKLAATTAAQAICFGSWQELPPLGSSALAVKRSPATTQRVFECKTCKRRFPSFQALGGHRASHKKPRLEGGNGDSSSPEFTPRMHGCAVCGMEFAVGQALGGHMRRHRSAASSNSRKRLLPWLDLNLPPAPAPTGDGGDDEALTLLPLQLHQFMDTGPIVVDC